MLVIECFRGAALLFIVYMWVQTICTSLLQIGVEIQACSRYLAHTYSFSDSYSAIRMEHNIKNLTVLQY